jgi:hypothetical protein
MLYSFFKVLYDNICRLTAMAIPINIKRSHVLSTKRKAEVNMVTHNNATEEIFTFKGMALCI